MSSVNDLCRLCSDNVDGNGWCIFGEEGKKNLFQLKIRLYLQFLVAEDDDLPKVLCSSCVHKLNNVHTFATMALCMQDRLRSRLRSRLGLHVLHNTDVSSAPLSQSDLTESVKKEDDVTNSEHEVILMEVDPLLILGSEEEDYGDVDEAENDDDPLEITDQVDISNGSCEDTVNSDESLATHQIDTREDNDSSSSLTKYQFIQTQKPFVCRYCSRGFMQEFCLRNHLWLHENTLSPSNSVSPSEEPKRREESKQREEKTVDNNIKLVKEEPKTESPRDDQIIETDLQLAEGFENNLCGVCRKSFESKSELESHLASHYQHGKFGCSICCRVFWSIECLEQHQSNHQLKNYICKDCGRMYSTKGSLRQHAVSHSNLRPHKCRVCPKTFKRNQDLKFHLNQHTGERPYLCPFCPKAFASSGNCFSHRKRMHPEDIKPRRSLVANINEG